MINGIFNEGGKMKGYATVNYTSDSDWEVVVETSERELSEAFEDAGVDELSGTDEPIAAAIEDPLRFRDFLILRGGEIAFDEEYVRETA